MALQRQLDDLNAQRKSKGGRRKRSRTGERAPSSLNTAAVRQAGKKFAVMGRMFFDEDAVFAMEQGQDHNGVEAGLILEEIYEALPQTARPWYKTSDVRENVSFLTTNNLSIKLILDLVHAGYPRCNFRVSKPCARRGRPSNLWVCGSASRKFRFQESFRRSSRTPGLSTTTGREAYRILPTSLPSFINNRQCTCQRKIIPGRVTYEGKSLLYIYLYYSIAKIDSPCLLVWSEFIKG
jgi:hypothetical protein